MELVLAPTHIIIKGPSATLGRELMQATEDKKIIKQRQNKKISVAKMEDLNPEKRRGCC